jgi:putative chitinase
MFAATSLALLALAADPAPPQFPALTAAQLRAIMPHLPADRAEQFLKPLNDAMKEFGINTPKRQTAFLAQIAHESGELKYMEEIASGEAYEGRKSLGNTEPGDGKRYKGRGPIQLTGRGNYRKAGEALKLDLEGKPETAAEPAIGCRVAGWFWKTHGLNELADKGDFRQITRRVNGGFNGQARREEYYKRAKDVLRVTD